MDVVYSLYKELTLKYKLSNYDARKLWNIIEPIGHHKEFERRCKAPFFHHDKTTLGEHILSDTILTYQIVNKIKTKTKMINLKTAVYIAMFHDLYEEPWQNNPKKKSFTNMHGFTHPVEAITNAITWYPEYFKSKAKALAIIDGVVHHMYPFPVRAFNGTDPDLNNKDTFEKLDSKYKDMIMESANISRLGKLSFRRTYFIEGRIVSKADKAVAFGKELKDLNGFMSLVSGKNKNIEELKI